MRAIYTLRFGEPSVCLWIYWAELSLLPLDECSICCTDRQLSKEKGMGPPRPFCHKSCHPDQLCREGGIGEKWEGDRRNSHVTASQEVFFHVWIKSSSFAYTTHSKPVENLLADLQLLKTMSMNSVSFSCTKQMSSYPWVTLKASQREWHLSNGRGKDLLVFLQKHVC